MNGNRHQSPVSRSGRPRKPEDEKLGVQIALRMDAALVARLDEHMVRLRQREPAVVWSRGSAIRSLMIQALAIAENEGNGASAPDDGGELGELRPPSNLKMPARLRAEEVLEIVRELEGAHARPVHAAQVRERMPDMPRASLDAALTLLERRGLIELAPPMNSADARERQGAVHHHIRGILPWIKTKAAPPPRHRSSLTTETYGRAARLDEGEDLR
jgi:hypothetical protein